MSRIPVLLKSNGINGLLRARRCIDQSNTIKTIITPTSEQCVEGAIKHPPFEHASHHHVTAAFRAHKAIGSIGYSSIKCMASVGHCSISFLFV